MQQLQFRRRCAAAIAITLPLVAHAAGTVTISGGLTSFQSTMFGNFGATVVNGVELAIDPNLPQLLGADGFLYDQSQTVLLPAGTTSAEFAIPSLANPNRITFTAADPALVNFGDEFKVGTLTYTNGNWSPLAYIGFSMTTASSDLALDNHTFTGSIVVRVSSPPASPVPDPEAHADFFYLEGASGPLSLLGSVRVYESFQQPAGNPGNTGSADLYARIGSLVPTRFDNPTGGAFLSASLEPVPEAGTWAMMAAGLAAVGTLAKRRSAAHEPRS
jgi:hypothetical protein